MTRSHNLISLYKLVGSTSFIEGSNNQSHVLKVLKESLLNSVSYVTKKNPKAREMFSLIGQMPGGATIECLNEIWGRDWYDKIVELEEAQLVQLKTEMRFGKQEQVYKLLPFMHVFSNIVNDEEMLKNMHISICQYFVKLNKKIFQMIGIQRFCDQQEKFRNTLVKNETNIWAALDRIRDYNLRNQSEQIEAQMQSERKKT